MKIDFSKTLKSYDGKDITGENGPATLKEISLNALTATLRGDENMSGMEKFKLYNLAIDIHKNPEVDISVENVSSIKDRIGKAYSQVVVGAAWSILEA